MQRDQPGWQIVQQVHKHLRANENRTLWHDDGFTWWSEQLAQRIRFEGPFDAYGLYICYLSFDTDFLRAHPGAEVHLNVVASQLASTPGLFTAYLVGQQLKLRGRHYVLKKDDEAVAAVVANYASCTNSIANRLAFSPQSDQWWSAVDIDADASGPASASRRDAPQESLGSNGIESHHQKLESLHVVPVDLNRIAAILASAGYPQVEELTERNLTVSQGIAAGRKTTITVDLAHESVLLGVGTRFTASIPTGVGDESIVSSWATDLNTLTWETRRSPVGMGTWMPGPDNTIVHVNFYPGQFLSQDGLEATVHQTDRSIRFAHYWRMPPESGH